MNNDLSNYLCSLMRYCVHYFEDFAKYDISVGDHFVVVSVLKDDLFLEKMISKTHSKHLRECLVNGDTKRVVESMFTDITERMAQ